MTTIVYARIDKTYIDSDLTNFPVGIKLTASHNILSGLGSTDYEGFHFTANGVECYAEVDIWDMVGEEAIIWVNVPNVYSDNDTIIKIENVGDDNTSYVGITGSTPAQTVWDSNFAAVYHMSQDPSGGTYAILDSTANGNDGTSQGTMTSGDLVDTGFGKAINFDGSDDYINLYNDSSLNTDITSEITIEGYVNPISSSAIRRTLLGNENETSDPMNGYSLRINTDFTVRLIIGTSSATNSSDSADSISNDVYSYLAGTYDGSAGQIYINGSANGSPTSFSGAIDQDTTETNIARRPRPDSFKDYFLGDISEIRLSKIARSDAWIKATYHVLNQDLITILEPTNDYLEVTIDSSLIDSDLTNFPIGIKIDSSDSILSGLGSTDYEGFHFFSNGVECYAEIDIWNMTGEEAIIWVNVPTVSSSSDSVIEIHNFEDDNTSNVDVTGNSAAQLVWDSNFVAVYHMSQDPSASDLFDSTSNSNNGTPNGSMTSGDLIDSGFGKAIDFDGSNDYFNVPHSSVFNVSNITMEAYLNFTDKTNDTYSRVFWKGALSDSAGSFELFYHSVNDYLRFILRSTTTNYPIALGGSLSNGTWYYAAGTYDGANEIGYLDGAEESNVLASFSIKTNTDSFKIGVGDAYRFFYGKLSEVRISSVARSSAWLKATYYVLSDGLLSKELIDITPPTVGTTIFGQISINGKYVNILGVSLVEKSKWRTVEEIYMLNDGDWRQNIKS